MRLRSLLLVAMTIASSSCFDPVHDRAVEDLGPERRGVREGPNHRPGQPCRVCHGGEGPGEPELSIAGTVYLADGLLEPASGVAVEVTDATRSTRTAYTNEVGNFYIGADVWAPAYPIRVTLRDPRAEQNGTKEMLTSIRSAGDCATCHRGEEGSSSHMPGVFLRSKPP